MNKLFFKSDIKLEDIEAMSEEDIANLSLDDLRELERLRNEKNHIKHKAKPETNAQDLRTQVLSLGIPAIEKVQQSLIDGTQLDATEMQAYQMLWPIIENLISKTEDLKVIEAKNASEVLTAVTKGKITMSEGLGMMALLKDQVAIDELPNLIAKLSQIDE